MTNIKIRFESCDMVEAKRDRHHVLGPYTTFLEITHYYSPLTLSLLIPSIPPTFYLLTFHHSHFPPQRKLNVTVS